MGEQGPKGDKGDTGERGPQGIQGERGLQGEKGDTGAIGAQGPKGDKGETGATGATGPQGPQGEKGDAGEIGPQGPKGDTGETGATGPQGPKGETGETGPQGPQGIQGETGPKGETGAAGVDGNDGVSCTHAWNGTVLSVTSASGTSSADLVGPQGPTGPTGATGPAGADGTTFAPVSPLALENGELSVDLSGYTDTAGLSPGIFAYWNYPYSTEDRNSASTYFGSGAYYQKVKVGDIIVNTWRMMLGRVVSVSKDNSLVYVTVEGLLDLERLRSFCATTEVDADPGQTVSGRLAYNRYSKHGFPEGCIFQNTTTGNLMRLTAAAIAPNTDSSTPVTVEGLCNLYEPDVDLSGYAALSGAAFTGAVSGIAPTADAHFATKKYVDDAVPAISASSPLSYSNGTMSIDLSAYALASDVPPNVVDATSFNMLVAEGSLFNFSAGVSSALFVAEVGDYVYDTRRNRIAIVTRKSVYGDNDEDFSMNGRTIFDFGKMHGIVTTTTLDVAPGSTGSGTVNSAGHAVLAGTLVLNLTSGNLMRATADAVTNNSNSPTVSVEGVANIYNANVPAGSTYTAALPLSIDANDEISIDLSAYAAIAGATFTGAVSGITPTANAHLATKGYVDGAIPSLSGYATETWVTQQINAAIAALDDLSEESF
ncbi:MAG: collagen-like protein [Eggerthellaceae bacterium]|nr:collagen-like protein [Eggerthellaceae bacterium]